MNKLTRTLDSREVAEMVGKNHAHLCRDIAKYIEVISENPKLDSLKYFIPSTFKVDGNNKTYVCYKLTKMGCEFVGNKMTGDKGILFTAAYVQRFNDVQELAKLFTDTAATQKQLDYIKAIQDDIGGDFTGTTKAEASEWLSRMVPIYKQWVRDRQLEAEIDAEIQDGRRDW